MAFTDETQWQHNRKCSGVGDHSASLLSPGSAVSSSCPGPHILRHACPAKSPTGPGRWWARPVLPSEQPWALGKIVHLNQVVQSVQSLSRVWLFATPWTAARQVSLSLTNSRNLRKLRSIESVMPSNHLILCHPSPSPAFNLSQHQGLFKSVSSSHHVAKVLEFQLQHQSFQWTFRTDFL